MEKKTKLTISGSAKKSIRNIEIAKTQGKNSRVIEKQGGKFTNRGGSFRPGVGKSKSTTSFNRGAPLKPSFAPKSPPITSDFERRKLAEQRALCSASFLLSKSLVIGGDFGAKDGFNGAPLLNEVVDFDFPTPGLNDPPLLVNFPPCFSITLEFFPCVLAISIFLIDFFAEPDIVNFVFFSIAHLSIFINYISSRHN